MNLIVQVRLFVAEIDEDGIIADEQTELDELHLCATDDYPHSFIASTYERVREIIMDAEPVTKEDSK